MPRTHLVLCRHAATEPNLANRFLSRTDPGLGRTGRAQCERLREALGAFAFRRAIVSPMRRCLETRELVAPELPFGIEASLREVDFGTWEGKTAEWIEDHQPGALARRRNDPVHFRPPAGESIEDAAARLRALADGLRNDAATLVIGHRVSLGVLERLVCDIPLDSPLVPPLEPAEFRIVRV